MNEFAPKLETVESLLAGNSLPLLVQRRNGGLLLLHKSQRLPSVICHDPKPSRPEKSYFTVPLDNTGYFGAVTSDDTPAPAYTTLRDALRAQTGDCQVLVGSSVEASSYSNSRRKPVNSLTEKGEVVSITYQTRCPKLAPSSLGKVFGCGCLATKKDGTSDAVVCSNDNRKHLHIKSTVSGSFYQVSDDTKRGLENGHAYRLQDIALHQKLPCIVSCIHQSPSPRDECTFPPVFRLMKVISSEVVFAYSLFSDYYPQTSDLLELSIYSTELFAISESAVVNTEKIRETNPKMSIRAAVPGVTLSYDSYYDITNQSRELPPPLPTRPATLRLSRTKADNLTRSLSFHERATYHTGPDDEVRLPTRTRSQRNIIQRFGTLLKPKSSRPTVKSILDQFHAKQAERENAHHLSKPKKSLRGLEITGPMNGGEVIDLSKPLSISIMTINSNKPKNSDQKLSREISRTDSTSKSSSEIGRWEINPSKYSEPADGSESAYETAPCSEESTMRTSARDSTNSSLYTSLNRSSSARRSGHKSKEPQLRVRRSEAKEADKSNRTSIRSLREVHLQLAQRRSTSDISQASDELPGDQVKVLRSSLRGSTQNSPPKKLSLQQSRSGGKLPPSFQVTDAYQFGNSKNSKPVVKRPLIKSPSAVLTSDALNMDHVTELKKRFSDIRLKPVTTNIQPTTQGKVIANKNGKSNLKLTNHTLELKKRLSEVALRIDQLTDSADPNWEAVDGGYLRPNRFP